MQVDFEVKHGNFTIGGFTREQQNMQAPFNREKEDALVRSCHETIAEVFDSPNKYERRLAKMNRVPLDKPATTKLYNNVIFTDDKEYHCVGSGGIGGGKVFWTPYTTENPELAEKIKYDDLCDNCKTTTHESQHGIGSDIEFDFFSDLVGELFRIRNLQPGGRLESRISSNFSIVAGGCKTNFRERFRREERNIMCSLNEREPQILREILTGEGWLPEAIQETLHCACGVSEGGD